MGSSVSLSDEAKKSLEVQAAHEADDTAGKQWLSRAATRKLHGGLEHGQVKQGQTSRTQHTDCGTTRRGLELL